MFVVIENTPGYLPEDDDPPVFEEYADAVVHGGRVVTALPTSSTSDTKEQIMQTTILSDETKGFLLDILSHDSDVIGGLFTGSADLDGPSEETEVWVRDQMSLAHNALIGQSECVPQHGVEHASFVGTRETNAGGFAIWTDRSLDEGPNVLTARCLDKTPFMGWIFGGDCAKFVEVSPRVAGFMADAMDIALDDKPDEVEEQTGLDEEGQEQARLVQQALLRVFHSVPRKPEVPQGCTGARDGQGRVHHDNETCPVHEVNEEPKGHEIAPDGLLVIDTDKGTVYMNPANILYARDAQ